MPIDVKSTKTMIYLGVGMEDVKYLLDIDSNGGQFLFSLTKEQLQELQRNVNRSLSGN
jgi:hypothetical protein